MIKKLILFILLFVQINTYAQIKITGQVTVITPSDSKGKLITNGSVFIPGIKESVIDDKGLYSLDLSQCAACLPGTILTIKVNTAEGFSEKECTLTTSKTPQECNLFVVKNNYISLTGIIKERGTGNFLSGIKVSAVVPDYSGLIPSTTTNESGVFQIPLQKEGIATQTAITLTMMDPSKSYEGESKVVFINQYAPIEIELRSSQNVQKKQVDNARLLAAEETLSNIQNLDQRLQFIAYSLKLNAKDNFSIKFDSIMIKWIPGIDSDPGSSLRSLITRSNIASLRQTLNSVPLKDGFGQALTQAFINSDMQNESYTASQYLAQFEDVKLAENTLFDVLEAYAGTEDTCTARIRRIGVAWATVQNRAAFFHISALRLLDALKFDVSKSPKSLNQLKVLMPKYPIDTSTYNKLMITRTKEMLSITKKRIEVLNGMQQCRDNSFDRIKDIDSMLTIKSSDTWQDVIIKSKTLRDLGRIKEAIDGFKKYEIMFSPNDKNAAQYSQMAVRFTERMPVYKVKGGLYIYEFTENSHIQDVGVQLGDILVILQQQQVKGMDQVSDIFLKTGENTPVKLEVLRWDSAENNFIRLKFTIPSKPMGGMFMPI